MFYVIFISTLLASVLIRWITLQLPNQLQRAWTKECIEYLQSKTTQQLHDDSLAPPHTPTVKRWHYLPFSSLFWQKTLHTPSRRTHFVMLDVFLLASSLFVFYHFDSYLYWASALLFTWLLITSSFIDFEHHILPDELTYILLWSGLVINCWNLYTYSTSSILGALYAYLALFIITSLFKLIRKKDGIGQGDLKFFAAIGAWVGFVYLPLILFLASIFSLIFILARKIITKKSCSAPAAFGPFLALAGWLVLLWGNVITTHLRF